MEVLGGSPCSVSPPQCDTAGGGGAVMLCSSRMECHRLPWRPGPSGYGPGHGQLHIPHLLLVDAVEAGILLGGEVPVPVPHLTCGTRGQGTVRLHLQPVPPVSPPCPLTPSPFRMKRPWLWSMISGGMRV